MCLGLLGDTDGLTDHVNQCHNERAKADTPKRVCQGATSSSPRRSSRHSARLAGTKEPRAVNASDDRVDGILKPLGDPVARESDENDQTNDFRGRAPTGARSARAGRVATAARGFVFDVDTNESDRKPGAESDGAEAADGGD